MITSVLDILTNDPEFKDCLYRMLDKRKYHTSLKVSTFIEIIVDILLFSKFEQHRWDGDDIFTNAAKDLLFTVMNLIKTDKQRKLNVLFESSDTNLPLLTFTPFVELYIT